jgi:prevent-host-death family protein
MSARRTTVGKASRGRVLIVGDRRSAPAPYARWLGRAGFTVAETAGAADAVLRLDRDRFDLVVSDVSTSQVDGLTLVKRMRARSLDVPVVLMLDGADRRTAAEAARLGVFPHLVKPSGPKELEETAAEVIRRHRAGASPQPGFRNRRGEPVEPLSFSASAAKNQFGRVLDMAIEGGVVMITKHDAVKAVLVSVDEFNALTRAREPTLDSLTAEFDRLLARMQTPKSRAGMKSAFEASPKQLGEAAVEAARQRG